MEKTTIYLDEDLKAHLLQKASDLSKMRGKRMGMADIIREAVREYVAKTDTAAAEKKVIVKRMLSTRGALGEGFEKRVKKARKEFKKWEIGSA